MVSPHSNEVMDQKEKCLRQLQNVLSPPHSPLILLPFSSSSFRVPFSSPFPSTSFREPLQQTYLLSLLARVVPFPSLSHSSCSPILISFSLPFSIQSTFPPIILSSSVSLPFCECPISFLLKHSPLILLPSPVSCSLP